MKVILSFVFAAIIAFPSYAGTFQRELPASPGESLTVELLPGGSIEVRGWDRNAVSIDATFTGDASSIEARRAGNGVQITQAFGSGHKARFKIQVPRRFDLDLDTNAGDLLIEGISGTIEGATRGGALRLGGLEGKLKLATNGGDIVLRDSNVGGKISTMGGQVLLENVSGDVHASSMGGNVTSRQAAGSVRGPAAVALSTMGGNVLVEGAPNGAVVSTMGGNVVVRNAGRQVSAKTMGGNIELAAIAGAITATTMGGNVAAVVAGGSGPRDVNIESKGGDIDLVVPSGLALDVDVEIIVSRARAKQPTIQSDLPLNITGVPATLGPRHIRGRGQSGAGTHKVRIRTIDGDVTIRTQR